MPSPFTLGIEKLKLKVKEQISVTNFVMNHLHMVRIFTRIFGWLFSHFSQPHLVRIHLCHDSLQSLFLLEHLIASHLSVSDFLIFIFSCES